MVNDAWNRSEGLNKAETRLAKLCDAAFLRMWSYPNPFKSPGDEICDLISIFGNNVVLFEVKEVKLEPANDIEKAWRRWFNNTIKKGARKLDWAQRQLSRYPDRVFLDSRATKSLPVSVPRIPDARFFRIVVALSSTAKIRALAQGFEGLQLQPDIIGAQHLPENNLTFKPFTIGRVGASPGYTHVLDDDALDQVLGELDTITDFLGYLKAKEELIESGRLAFAASELDLLANFVYPRDNKSSNRFSETSGSNGLVVNAGLWESLQNDAHYLKRKDEDKVSYVWDDLIEHGAQDFVRVGGAPTAEGPTYREAEGVFYFMARESRFQRRRLGGEVVGMLENTKRSAVDRRTRSTESSYDDGTYFVFQALASNRAASQEEYRAFRRQSLDAACLVTKLQRPDASRAIGVAMDMWPNHLRSIDVTYRDFAGWDLRKESRARRLDRVHRFTRNSQSGSSTIWEYPDPDSPTFSAPFRAAPKVVRVKNQNEAWSPEQKGADRNKPCDCGSGRKAKHCCLKARQARLP